MPVSRPVIAVRNSKICGERMGARAAHIDDGSGHRVHVLAKAEEAEGQANGAGDKVPEVCVERQLTKQQPERVRRDNAAQRVNLCKPTLYHGARHGASESESARARETRPRKHSAQQQLQHDATRCDAMRCVRPARLLATRGERGVARRANYCKLHAAHFTARARRRSPCPSSARRHRR